jgi:multiple sugar transport system substrate-binding protein
MKLTKLIVLLLSISFLVVSSTVVWGQQKTQITVQTYWSLEPPGGVAWSDIIKKYESSHPDVEIKHYYVPFGDLVKKLITQALTGDFPDVVFADNPDVQYLARAGVFKDITKLVQEWGVWKDYIPGSQLAVTYRGKIYALHQTTNNLALWYNKDYFKQIGIASPPETWDELINVCQKLKASLPKVYPIGFSARNTEEGTWQFEPFLWSSNGSLLALDKPEAVRALDLWTTLVKEGYAPRDVLNWGQGDLTQYFKNKQLAMMIQGCWELNQSGLEDFKKNGMVFGNNFDVAQIPVPKKGMKPVVPMGGECFTLPAKGNPQKEKIAWDFVKFLNDSKNMADFCANTGRVPTRISAIEPLLKDRPDLKVFTEQAKSAVPRPAAGAGEKYTDVSTITREAIQKALSGTLSPGQAFKEASEKIRKLFSTDEEYNKALVEARSALSKVRK